MYLPKDLVKKITDTPRKHKTFIIGIDGFGGSGKSTLARLLKEHFGNVTIVGMDNFYHPSLKRADYQRVLKQVLLPLTSATPASYQRYDWKTDTLAEWHPVEVGGMVIIEGVYSTNNEMKDLYDFKIWVECPQEVASERGIARDLQRDNTKTRDEWLRDKWTNDWMPREKEYATRHNPKQYADYIIDGMRESA